MRTDRLHTNSSECGYLQFRKIPLKDNATNFHTCNIQMLQRLKIKKDEYCLSEFFAKALNLEFLD